MLKVQKKTTHTLAGNHEDGDKSSIQTTQPIRASTVEHVTGKRGREPSSAHQQPCGDSGRDPRPPSRNREEASLAEEVQGCEKAKPPRTDPSSSLPRGFGPLTFSCSETSRLSSLAGGVSPFQTSPASYFLHYFLKTPPFQCPLLPFLFPPPASFLLQSVPLRLERVLTECVLCSYKSLVDERRCEWQSVHHHCFRPSCPLALV